MLDAFSKCYTSELERDRVALNFVPRSPNLVSGRKTVFLLIFVGFPVFASFQTSGLAIPDIHSGDYFSKILYRQAGASWSGHKLCSAPSRARKRKFSIVKTISVLFIREIHRKTIVNAIVSQI